MKKLRLTDIRGQQAETRFMNLARSLKQRNFVRSVRKAPPTMDKHGVDFIVFIHSLTGKRDIRVPFQVKSSISGVTQYHEKHPLCKEAGVVTVVVNNVLPDEQIISVIRNGLEDIQSTEKDFQQFFAKLKTFESGGRLKKYSIKRNFG